MSDLTERILDTVRAIPEGRVMTYGDIARVTGTAARAVGRVLHNSGHEIPWWRVVDADGRPYPARSAPCGRSSTRRPRHSSTTA